MRNATVSVRLGRVSLTFTRKCSSLKEAVLSAINNVRDAGIGAAVLRVDACHLVTQSEISRRIARSRQLVNQYISGARGPGNFPAPVCNLAEGAPLWSWSDVAAWLQENEIIGSVELCEALDLNVINCVLELEHQRSIAPELTSEIIHALSSDARTTN